MIWLDSMNTITFQQSIYHSNDTARGNPMAKYPGIPCIVGYNDSE